MNTTYELSPKNNQKSFYGKARVCIMDNGDEVLISYDTPVIRKDAEGNLYRLWGGWSATTGRHVASYCGLNKKQYLALPYQKRSYSFCLMEA